MVPSGSFVTMTLAGTVPRSFWATAADPGTIQTAFSSELQNDGLIVRSMTFKGTETAGGLFQAGYPYLVTVTVQTTGDFGAAEDIGSIIANAAQVSIGDYPTSQTIPAISDQAPPPPTAPADSGGLFSGLSSGLSGFTGALQGDITLTIVVLGILAIGAVLLLSKHPEVLA